MNIFQKKFYKLLEAPEDEIDPLGLPRDAGAEATPGGDDAAFEAGLDQDTDPGSFDDVPDNPVNNYKREQATDAIGKIEGWIQQTEQWIDQLNGVGTGSINELLAQADCDSILNDIHRSESKKIGRLAQDLSSLSESLKQYLLSAQRDARGGNPDA